MLSPKGRRNHANKPGNPDARRLGRETPSGSPDACCGRPSRSTGLTSCSAGSPTQWLKFMAAFKSRSMHVCSTSYYISFYNPLFILATGSRGYTDKVPSGISCTPTLLCKSQRDTLTRISCTDAAL